MILYKYKCRKTKIKTYLCWKGTLMKSCLFLLLLTGLSLKTMAQRVRFSDTTNKWVTTHIYNSGGASGTVTSYTDYHYADSVAEWNGKSYHVLMQGQKALGLVREDTTLKKVFLKPLDTMFGNYLKVRANGEFVYMDYSLQENDTLTMPLTYDSDTTECRLVVTSVDSILMNGITHKVLHMNAVSGFEYGGNYAWIEGLGSSETGPVIEPTHPSAGLIKRVICFRNNGTFPIDSLSACDIPTGIGESQSMPAISLEIFPNPAKDVLIVTNHHSGNRSSLTLSDELGQVVYAGQLHQQITIDTRDFTDGIYFLRVEQAGHALFRKIVIRH